MFEVLNFSISYYFTYADVLNIDLPSCYSSISTEYTKISILYKCVLFWRGMLNEMACNCAIDAQLQKEFE